MSYSSSNHQELSELLIFWKLIMNSQFDLNRYRAKLKTRWLGADFVYEPELKSTNTYLKKMDSSGFDHGTVLLTDHQTQGRGQYERSWESQRGKNLTFTVAFKPSSGDRLPLLTLTFAFGIVRALKRLDIENVRIKWPNDILINGKKVGGLLTETVFLGQKPDRVLIGIGLNVNQETFGNELNYEATSVKLEKGKEVRREDLLCSLLQEFEHQYTRWTRRESDLCKDVNSTIEGFGQWVTASMNGTVKEGEFKFLGMNEKAECVMLNKELDVKTFSYEQIRIFPRR
ncbi:biotin--[acetyl-CoA-carboxylase] ligase [Rhodohalobacter sp. SW132]|nr:biotin--[acetyl-CoA-carboxylase] ligase [Rhodohalobacter sp. SW132]